MVFMHSKKLEMRWCLWMCGWQWWEKLSWVTNHSYYILGSLSLRFSYGRCIVSVIYFLCLFDFLDRSTAKKKPPSCEEKCLTDWTAKDTPDCIKKDACKRACNEGTCTAWIQQLNIRQIQKITNNALESK